MRDALDMGSAVVMTWSEFYFARAPKARWELGRRRCSCAGFAHSLPHLLPVVPAKPFPTIT